MSVWLFSPSVRRAAGVPARLWRKTEDPASFRDHEDLEFPLVVACASDILGERGWRPSAEAVSVDTRYLILADVPVPALARLISVFDVRRPDQRMHMTDDPRSIVRLLISQFRDVPLEGIVDAYLFAGDLVLLLGDLSKRSFPIERIPALTELDRDALGEFEIDDDGSFLYWAAVDLHLGVSQLLQAVDPASLADIEIRRFPASLAIGQLIAEMREQHGLRQRDVPGLSERQVRRIEQGVSRLTSDAASKFAALFGLGMDAFLARLSAAASAGVESAASKFQEEEASVGGDALP